MWNGIGRQSIKFMLWGHEIFRTQSRHFPHTNKSMQETVWKTTKCIETNDFETNQKSNGTIETEYVSTKEGK